MVQPQIVRRLGVRPSGDGARTRVVHKLCPNFGLIRSARQPDMPLFFFHINENGDVLYDEEVGSSRSGRCARGSDRGHPANHQRCGPGRKPARSGPRDARRRWRKANAVKDQVLRSCRFQRRTLTASALSDGRGPEAVQCKLGGAWRWSRGRVMGFVRSWHVSATSGATAEK
jgi:hypothetical protein